MKPTVNRTDHGVASGARTHGTQTTTSLHANHGNQNVSAQGRTGKNPTVDDTFLWRVCHALDMPPRMLAARIDVPFAELQPLLGVRHHLVEIDRDYVWWKIAQLVNVRIGELMAVRHELDKALQRDRASRAVRIARQQERPSRSSPRS